MKMKYTVPIDPRWTRVSMITLLLVSLYSTPAAAQTLFQWPSTQPDVSHYHTVEDCLAAVQRVDDSVSHRSLVVRDTMPSSGDAFRRPLPPRVVETARTCSAQYTVTSVSLNDFALLVQLFLDAGRDVDARALVQRRLQGLPKTDTPAADSERAAVLDSIVDIYLDAQPIRWTEADTLLQQWLHNPSVRIEHKFIRLVLLRDKLLDKGDSVHEQQLNEHLVQLAHSLPPEERPLLNQPLASNEMFITTYRIHQAALLDSLRHSTTAFIEYQRELRKQLSGTVPQDFPFPLGKQAPQLQGAFWFPPSTATPATHTASSLPVLPAPGQVNLVVFNLFRHLDRGSTNISQDWGHVAVLKRLMRRYPSLNVSIVVQTRGYFGNGAPPTPEQEAALYNKMTHDFLGIPANLIVENTPFWHLKAPDGRRMNRATPDMTNYAFGQPASLTGKPAFGYLIDPNGRVVWRVELGRGWEESADSAIIGALVAQQGH